MRQMFGVAVVLAALLVIGVVSPLEVGEAAGTAAEWLRETGQAVWQWAMDWGNSLPQQ